MNGSRSGDPRRMAKRLRNLDRVRDSPCRPCRGTRAPTRSSRGSSTAPMRAGLIRGVSLACLIRTSACRSNVPIVHIPPPDEVTGLGDIDVSLFLTAAKADKCVWGVGPRGDGADDLARHHLPDVRSDRHHPRLAARSPPTTSQREQQRGSCRHKCRCASDGSRVKAHRHPRGPRRAQLSWRSSRAHGEEPPVHGVPPTAA